MYLQLFELEDDKWAAKLCKSHFVFDLTCRCVIFKLAANRTTKEIAWPMSSVFEELFIEHILYSMKSCSVNMTGSGHKDNKHLYNPVV